MTEVNTICAGRERLLVESLMYGRQHGTEAIGWMNHDRGGRINKEAAVCNRCFCRCQWIRCQAWSRGAYHGEGLPVIKDNN